MKNRNRILVILLAVLVVLVAAYAGLRSWNTNREKQQEAEEEADVIDITDMGEVTAFTYDIGSGPLSFILQDEEWVYKENPLIPINQSIPSMIASDYGFLTADRKLDDADDLESYGLEDPIYTVELENGDGERHTIYFGNAVDEEYYITVDDDKEVYTVSSAVAEDLQYGLEDMIAQDSFPTISEEDLIQVSVTQNGKTIVSEDEDSLSVIQEGLSEISSALTADDLAAYGVDADELTSYGLDEEHRITVKVTYTDGEEETITTLYLGQEDEEGDRYLMLDDSSLIYLLPDETADQILMAS